MADVMLVFIFSAVSLLFLLGVILLLWEFFKVEREINFIYGAIVFGVLASILVFLAIATHRSDPRVEYKALITDFNEVYEQGYKIISQEGKIYTLEKAKSNLKGGD